MTLLTALNKFEMYLNETECPTCNAVKGCPCQDKDGRFGRSGFHQERWDAGEKQGLPRNVPERRCPGGRFIHSDQLGFLESQGKIVLTECGE